jgi:hypothetical protein
MTRFEQTWTADVLTAFTLEPEDSPRARARDNEVDYLSTFRRMRQGSTRLAGLALRLGVWMVALAPLWFLGRVATFSKLARRERTELLVRLLVHNSFVVRELTMLLKLTAAMALMGTASVRARSGYDNVQPPAAQIETGARVRLPMVARPPVDTAQAHSDSSALHRAVP